jgi:peptidyl-prolyl cis-trans isomerase C
MLTACYDGKMTFFRRALLLLLPAASLLAQGLPPRPQPPVPPAASAPAVPPDKVVLVVNDVKLTAKQFNDLVEALPEQLRNSARGPGKRDFAQNLAKVLVLANEGKSRKIDQTPEFKLQEQIQVANLLAGRTFSQLAEGLKVDEADERAFYDAHKQDYEQVRARHILIRAAGSPSAVEPGKKELSDAEALAKAQDIRKKLAAGGDFAALAAQESDDPGSKDKGGDLNFFKHGQMVPTFDQAAFSLKVGEISEPVKTQFGYHIIKVEARKSYEDSKSEVDRRVRGELAQKMLDDLQNKANPTFDADFFGPATK